MNVEVSHGIQNTSDWIFMDLRRDANVSLGQSSQAALSGNSLQKARVTTKSAAW